MYIQVLFESLNTSYVPILPTIVIIVLLGSISAMSGVLQLVLLAFHSDDETTAKLLTACAGHNVDEVEKLLQKPHNPNCNLAFFHHAQLLVLLRIDWIDFDCHGSNTENL